MRVEDCLVFGKSHCHSDIAKILLGELLGKNPLELLNYLEEQVPEELYKKYQEEVMALESGKPLQYVMGHVNFYGNQFHVDERVLIPRYETEELVENTIKLSKELFTEPVDILDLGTGSGVIGLTLENKLSTNSVDLIDISREALEVAKINGGKLKSKANYIESDFFEKVNKLYDIIISNPPYIKDDEEIEEIVKNNEPHLALYAGEKGLDCYNKILKEAQFYMKEKAILAFEIGATQKDDIIELINKYMDNVEITCKQDLSGRDRMIFIIKNPPK